MKHTLTFLAVLLLALPKALLAAEAEQPWLKPNPVALERWQEMRFGMFIHWGPVIPATTTRISWTSPT